MTMKLHILAYGLVLATTVAACSDEKKDSKEKEGVETVLPSLPNEVTVVPLEAVEKLELTVPWVLLSTFTV